MEPDDWFLSPRERGNAATDIDRRRPGGLSYTEGNHVEVLIDGAAYYSRLYGELRELEAGDSVHFTDWQGDSDELLDGAGTAIGQVLASLARAGVHVRGLVWRSHPRQAHFAEQDNAALAEAVNSAGGEVLLDERVRRGGSHHQKLVTLRRERTGERVAFMGGIDLCHGRRDDSRHTGDPQAVALDERYGDCPPWHDVQLQLRGPAVADLAYTFWERWVDPTPLDHRNPWRRAWRRLRGQPRHPGPLPEPPVETPFPGSHAVQVLRTYPAKRPVYPFAPNGERSVARAYLKAFRRARRLVYIEDQYLWSAQAAGELADALRREPQLHVVVVVPRYPDRGGRLNAAAAGVGREIAIETLRRAGGDRVALYDLENASGTPIYVHAKVCVIDDVLLIVGSDNVNRRSWTHDSELSCSVIDDEVDDREPLDPGEMGDCARKVARETRLRLWREHLGRADGDDVDLVDLDVGFATLAAGASALDDWHRHGRLGPRPSGHLRHHVAERVAPPTRWFGYALYRTILDPDGRPWRLRRTEAM